MIPKNLNEPRKLFDEPPALRRTSADPSEWVPPVESRSSAAHSALLGNRRRKAGGSFRSIAHRHFVGFAILCSLALLDHAAAPAASGPPGLAIRGTVVDEKGVPVPNVRVAAVEGFGHMPDFFTQSDAAGNFTFELPGRFSVVLFASDATGERMGYLWGRGRLVLQKSRAIPATVIDGKGRPVAGAKIFAGFYLFVWRLAPRAMLERSTGADGKALLRLPRDMPLEHVYALKPGTGFDYVNYYYREGPKADPAVPKMPRKPDERAQDDDRPIQFVLGGVHKLRLHLVDQRRRPVPGVRVAVMHLERPNRGGSAGIPPMQEFRAVSDPVGIAEFQVIPAEATGRLGLQSATLGYVVRDRPTLNPGDRESDLTLVVQRLPVLRVKVTWPDGRPALGTQIHATSRDYSAHRGRPLPWARPGTLRNVDRSYDAAEEIDFTSFTNDAYCVVSARSKGFVSTTEARVARIDEPMRPVHLVLQPAVHVHGRLTWGKDHQPDANDAVTLVERDDHYAKLPEEERLPRTLPLAELAHVAIDIPHHATTDAQGRFDFEVPPGQYVIAAGDIRSREELEKAKDDTRLLPDGLHEMEIKDQKEVEIDLHCEQRTPIKRRVAPNKGLPN